MISADGFQSSTYKNSNKGKNNKYKMLYIIMSSLATHTHTVPLYLIDFTQVQSAGHFWVTSNEGNSASYLQEIQRKMERTVQQGVAHHLPYKLVTPGRPVIAEYTDPYDGITGYYRARVEEIFPGPDEKTLRALVRIGTTG